MAEGGKEPAESRGSAAARARAARQETHGSKTRTAGRTVTARPERYLVTVAPPGDARTLASELEQDRETRVLRTSGLARALREAKHPGSRSVVIETTAERAAALAARGQLSVEPDQRLVWGATEMPGGAAAVAPVGELRVIQVLVADDAGHPVADAAVWLTGLGGPAIAYTRPDGHAELTVPVETAVAPDELRVRPARGCWPAKVVRPQVYKGEPLPVVCERLVTTFPDFPERALDSWGARVMGFPALPPTHRGNGIRLAIIGSGAAAGHPDLTGRITDGLDVVAQDQKSWQEDPVGTGTHLAVLLAGRDDGGGVVGLVPEAELHICKVAPGGHCSDLAEALDYCVAANIDVALITIGVRHPSMTLAEKIMQARAHGVACIAAAGDGAEAIGHPAALGGVLAVGAVGMIGTYPPDSGLAMRIAGVPGPAGFFAPAFANHGPGIDCCGPGVGIVSGVAPASYGPLDGTAVAAAHVAGAAALVLAHHPGMRTPPGSRHDAERVDRLFQLLVAACRPLPGVSPAIAGAGLPDVAVAAGVAPWTAYPSWAASRAVQEEPADALTALGAAMHSAGLLRPA